MVQSPPIDILAQADPDVAAAIGREAGRQREMRVRRQDA